MQPAPPNSKELREGRAHGSQSFRCAFYAANPDADCFHAQLHWHEELEIIFFQKGHFVLEINMERYEFNEECIFFVNSGELHRITCDEPCTESAVVFAPHLLGFLSNDEAQSRIIAPLIARELLLPRCLKPGQDGYPLVRREFLQLSENIPCTIVSSERAAEHPDGRVGPKLPSPARQLLIKASLLNILGCLSGFGLLRTARPHGNAGIESIKTVLSYIHTHYQEKIFVSDLSGLLNLNEQYFCRFFKKAIGQSPIAYVNEYRIRQAIDLLEKTDMPVTEICLECGFNNFGNFLREFRAQTNTTPQQYRKRRSQNIV